ncbi:MAG: hypothetical protein GTO24_08075 [candidate division Zixibacteria bacterium]|nr:hypothetical protein [candidate division Zixibacteria bacterium]
MNQIITIHESMVFLKKLKLISHASFKVIPNIDIKVTDWIVFYFCMFP